MLHLVKTSISVYGMRNYQKSKMAAIFPRWPLRKITAFVRFRYHDTKDHVVHIFIIYLNGDLNTYIHCMLKSHKSKKAALKSMTII